MSNPTLRERMQAKIERDSVAQFKMVEDSPINHCVGCYTDGAESMLDLVCEMAEALKFYKNKELYFNYYDGHGEVTVIENDCGFKSKQALQKLERWIEG